MKKQKTSNRSSNQKTRKKAATTEAPADPGRRKFLGIGRNAAIGAVAVVGVGLFFAQTVRSSMHEHDLSRVGNGIPTVVQVHDPQCSLCLSLQRETRQALKQLDGNEIDYVVANIRSADGKRFADQYRVPHVTLLLFDENGTHRGTMRGQRQSEELATAFRQLVGY
ncbi:MAG: hypothetical protein AAF724_00245 [Pseudomonadota bacterium]